jgi:hypothetical protein
LSFKIFIPKEASVYSMLYSKIWWKKNVFNCLSFFIAIVVIFIVCIIISRPPIQRQSSSSGSGTKYPKVLEPAPTPASFPKPHDQAQLIEAPTFFPTEKDFQDPLEYIERIKPMAEQFGLCRIVPPSAFKVNINVMGTCLLNCFNENTTFYFIIILERH